MAKSAGVQEQIDALTVQLRQAEAKRDAAQAKWKGPVTRTMAIDPGSSFGQWLNLDPGPRLAALRLVCEIATAEAAVADLLAERARLSLDLPRYTDAGLASARDTAQAAFAHEEATRAALRAAAAERFAAAAEVEHIAQRREDFRREAARSEKSAHNWRQQAASAEAELRDLEAYAARRAERAAAA